MAYIYQITNDVNGKVYIGKTEFSIEKRFKEHCRDRLKRDKENRPLYRAMNKYGIEHFHIELLEETDNPEEREKFWIEEKRSFKQGYNATLGGDGTKYLDRNLIVQTYKEVNNIAEVARLLGYDEHSILYILREEKVHVLTSQEVSKKFFSKPVGQFDKNNNLLVVHESIGEAAKSIGKPKQHISECANGKRKTAYGFIWKFI